MIYNVLKVLMLHHVFMILRRNTCIQFHSLASLFCSWIEILYHVKLGWGIWKGEGMPCWIQNEKKWAKAFPKPSNFLIVCSKLFGGSFGTFDLWKSLLLAVGSQFSGHCADCVHLGVPKIQSKNVSWDYKLISQTPTSKVASNSWTWVEIESSDIDKIEPMIDAASDNGEIGKIRKDFGQHRVSAWNKV